jgi:hypothetical protein
MPSTPRIRRASSHDEIVHVASLVERCRRRRRFGKCPPARPGPGASQQLRYAVGDGGQAEERPFALVRRTRHMRCRNSPRGLALDPFPEGGEGVPVVGRSLGHGIHRVRTEAENEWNLFLSAVCPSKQVMATLPWREGHTGHNIILRKVSYHGDGRKVP